MSNFEVTQVSPDQQAEQGPRYRAEIATSAKGFHSFAVKCYGDDLATVIAETKLASDQLGEYCNQKNEVIK